MATKDKPEAQAELPDRNDPAWSLHQRMNWIMSQINYLQKEKSEGLGYSIVSHDAVTELVRPFMVEAGIVYYPVDLNVTVDGNRTQAVFDVRFCSIANSSDFIDVATMGFGIDKQDKGPGKALSYGVKYALLKALGLATGDDPDRDQGADFNHRTTLDKKADELADLVDDAEDSNALQTIMNSQPTRAIMESLQEQQPETFRKLRARMSQRSKDLKAREQAAAESLKKDEEFLGGDMTGKPKEEEGK